jgi:hypothetical protein
LIPFVGVLHSRMPKKVKAASIHVCLPCAGTDVSVSCLTTLSKYERFTPPVLLP